MALTAEQIDAIRARVDIVQAIGQYVALRPSGQRLVGLCPFHAEKTPSFSVSPSRGLFYCFGCHAGGDIFSFLMRHQGLTFVEAAEQLAATAGVAIAPESAARTAQKQAEAAVCAVNNHALAFFCRALWQQQGQECRAYMQLRQIPPALARAKQLGFGGQPGELLSALHKLQVPPELMAQAGLLAESGNRSLFDGRLIFPIFDAAGRCVGFGGRRLKEEAHSPKYINTRESPIFSKRRYLYGFYEAQDAIRRSQRVVIVEGYVDVLAAWQSGIAEAVAALGTAFTAEHANLCSRIATDATVLLDADAAGQRAAHTVTTQLLRAGLRTSVAVLPPGEDPDSLRCKAGPRALQACITQAQAALDHFIDALLPVDQPMSIAAKVNAAQQIASLLSSVKTGLEQELYTARLAERVGVTPAQLRQHLALAGTTPRRETTKQQRVRPGSDQAQPQQAESPTPPAGDAAPSTAASGSMARPTKPRLSAEQLYELEMLRELLLYPELRPRLMELAEFALTAEMRQLLDALAQAQAPAAEVIEQHLAHASTSWVQRLQRIKPAQPAATEDVHAKAAQTFTDVQQRLKYRHLDAALRDVLQQLQRREAQGGDTAELMRRKRDLTRRKMSLKRANRSA